MKKRSDTVGGTEGERDIYIYIYREREIEGEREREKEREKKEREYVIYKDIMRVIGSYRDIDNERVRGERA